MKRYHISDIENVRKLRQTHKYSFSHLERLTGIPQTTIRTWCKDQHIGTKWDTLVQTNRRIRNELKQKDLACVGNLKNINREQAKLFVALLYWCEGSKYPSSTAVTMVNSDASLLKTFIELLRKAYSLDEAKFHAHVQIHNSHNYEDIKQYWSTYLRISTEKFMKPTITKPRGMKHRDGYYGTCTVKYQDYRVLLRITGIFESFVTHFGEVA